MPAAMQHSSNFVTWATSNAAHAQNIHAHETRWLRRAYTVESKRIVLFQWNLWMVYKVYAVRGDCTLYGGCFTFLFVLDGLNLCCIITGHIMQVHYRWAALSYMSDSLEEMCESVDKWWHHCSRHRKGIKIFFIPLFLLFFVLSRTSLCCNQVAFCFTSLLLNCRRFQHWSRFLGSQWWQMLIVWLLLFFVASYTFHFR